MSNGDDKTIITEAERNEWLNDQVVPEWLVGVNLAEWQNLGPGGRLSAVERYMDTENMELAEEEEEDEPTYLGGYIAPVQTLDSSRFGEASRTGAYEAGDEYDLFRNQGSVFIASLQDRMINAGLIQEDGVYRFGQWTSYEAKAMRNILSLANETGLPWSSVLVDFRRRRAESGEGTGGALPTKFVENEDELTSRLQASLPGLLGGNFLSESDARGIARAYRDYASGKTDEAARGGTVEKAMSFNTFVEKQEGIEEGATANRFALLTSALAQLNKV